jgi:hypothetical protein
MPRIDYAICTRPDFEMATYIGSLALQYAVDYIRTRGINLDDLRGDDAVRTKVLDSLARNDPIWFIGLGHGNETLFTGQGYDKIFWTCDNTQLRGRVAFMLSCITAAELGPDSVNNKGCVCYIGYSDTFSWTQEAMRDPLTDPIGKAFFECVLELIYRLADGYTTGEAFKASIDKWNYWIDYWSRSTDPFAPAVLMLLLHDRDCQKLIGDENARVSSAIPSLWWPLALGLGFIPVGAVASIAGGEELRKAGLLAV